MIWGEYVLRRPSNNFLTNDIYLIVQVLLLCKYFTTHILKYHWKLHFGMVILLGSTYMYKDFEKYPAPTKTLSIWLTLQ